MPRAAKTSSQQQREDREWQEALANRPDALPKEALKKAIANTPTQSKRRSLGIASVANTPAQHRVASSRPLARISKLLPETEDDEDTPGAVPNLLQLPADSSSRTGENLQVAPRSDDMLRSVCKKNLKTYSKSKKTPQLPNLAHPAQEAVVSDAPREPLQEDSELQSESSHDEEGIDVINIDILGALDAPPDPEVHERQCQIGDDPPPKKKRRTQKQQRRLPVGELITASERVHEDASHDDKLEIHSVTFDVKLRGHKNRKRKGSAQVVQETKIRIKHLKEKRFKMNMKHFRIPKAAVPHQTSTSPEALSDGFEKHEKAPTGRLMPIKRLRVARHSAIWPVIPQATIRTKALTIVPDKHFESVTPGKKKDKRKRRDARDQEQLLDAAQNLELPTPAHQKSEVAKLAKTNTKLKVSSVDYHDSPAPQSVNASSSKHTSIMGPATSSPLRQKAERNSQSQIRLQQAAQVEKQLTAPKSKAQRRKEEELLISEELSAVIVKRRPTSDSDSSEDEIGDESENGSISSSLHRSPGNQRSVSDLSDNESQEEDEDEQEGGEQDHDKENSDPGDNRELLEGVDEDVDEEVNEEIHEEVSKEPVEDVLEPVLQKVDQEEDEQQASFRPGISTAGSETSEVVSSSPIRTPIIRNFAFNRASHLGSRLTQAEDVTTPRTIIQKYRQYTQKEDEDDGSSWRPRIPVGALETEDELTSSPAQFRTPSTRNPPFRKPSRISPQLPVVQEESQGNVILGDNNFGSPARRREIPETQINDPGAEIFSQLSYAPASSYFERASQHLQQSPRKPSLRSVNIVPRLDSTMFPMLTPGLGPKRTISRSLKKITRKTSSQFGTLGSNARKRYTSTPLLTSTPRFKV